ncbi:hypothetical protein [Microcoleus sp. herbarium12]|uniref:hypothetical protein n=1 Tax=Microcoleus sp. herbarium12 TaxID=3055437 RepID=UPI002FCFB7A8
MGRLTVGIDSMSGSGAIVSRGRSRLKSKASVTFFEVARGLLSRWPRAPKYSGDRPRRQTLIFFGKNT